MFSLVKGLRLVAARFPLTMCSVWPLYSLRDSSKGTPTSQGTNFRDQGRTPRSWVIEPPLWTSAEMGWFRVGFRVQGFAGLVISPALGWGARARFKGLRLQGACNAKPPSPLRASGFRV